MKSCTSILTLHRIDIIDSRLVIDFQSNIQETADGVNWTPAITHTMWLEDGVLMFKDNP